MTVQRKILVAMEAVFPAGAFLVGPVEPVWNFDKAVQRPDGSRPQQLDKETGLPIWQAPADHPGGLRGPVDHPVGRRQRPAPAAHVLHPRHWLRRRGPDR